MFNFGDIIRMYDEDGTTFFDFKNGDILKILPDYSIGDNETYQRYFYYDVISERWSEIHPGNIR